MKPLSHDGRAARLRRPDMPNFGEKPRAIPPIEKVSRVTLVHLKTGEPRKVILSLPRVRWIEERS